METKIQKWGNSLGLRIPSSFAEEVAVRAGSTVDISLAENGCLMVKPVPMRYDLSEMLEQVTDENIHAEIDTGSPRGKEVW